MSWQDLSWRRRQPLAQLAKSAPTPARNQILASLTLTLAFGVNLISAWPLARSEYIALFISFLLAGTLAAGLLSNRYGQLGFLASPWTVSLLLLAAPWVSRDALDGLTSPFLKMALSMLSLVIVLAGASVWHRVRPRQGTRVLAHAALATSIFGIFLDSRRVSRQTARHCQWIRRLLRGVRIIRISY